MEKGEEESVGLYLAFLECFLCWGERGARGIYIYIYIYIEREFRGGYCSDGSKKGCGEGTPSKNLRRFVPVLDRGQPCCRKLSCVLRFR